MWTISTGWFWTKQAVSNIISSILILIVALIGIMLNRYLLYGLPWNMDTAMICLPFAYVGYLAFQKREEYNSKCSILIDMIVFALFLFTSLFNDVRKVSFSSGIYGNYCFMYLSGISGSFLLIELAKRLALLRSGWMLRMIKLWGKHSILIMGLDYLTRACIKAVLANVCVGVLQMLLIMICQFFILSIALYVWEMITLISIKNHNNML